MWGCMKVYKAIWRYLEVYEDIWRCMKVYTSIWTHFFDIVWGSTFSTLLFVQLFWRSPGPGRYLIFVSREISHRMPSESCPGMHFWPELWQYLWKHVFGVKVGLADSHGLKRALTTISDGVLKVHKGWILVNIMRVNIMRIDSMQVSVRSTEP